MPPDEVAEAERLHDLAEEEDHFFVLECVVEGHGANANAGGVKLLV